MLAFAGQETRTTIGVTNDAFTLRVTSGAWWPLATAMVTRRVSEAAADLWRISSAAVAKVYRIIERWVLRTAR